MAKVKYLVLEAEDNWTKDDYRKKLVEDLKKINDLLYEVNDIFDWCGTFDYESKDSNDEFIINTICDEYWFSDLDYEEFINAFSNWAENINEQIEEDEKRSNDCESKLAMIKEKRKKLDDEKADFEKKQKEELEALEEKIRILNPRIDSLVKIGDTLGNNYFDIKLLKALIYKRVGFVFENNHLAVGCFEEKNNPSSFGLYPQIETRCDFIAYSGISNGKEYYKVSGSGELAQKILLCKDFLNGFDEFEKRVDEYLEKNMK